jgi:hypothetical protein
MTPLLGLAVVALAAALVASSYRAPKPRGRDSSALPPSENVGGPQLAARHSDAGGTLESPPLLVSDLGVPDLRIDAGGGATMPDGTGVPPLPANVPRQVRFGVVLVSYAGAQPSVSGGRPAVRGKGEALVLAEKLRATAEQDFHAAVQQGDSGSADDVGRIKVGMLEPAPEYILFTLPVGGVGSPVDTPRGYWVVKRLE